MMIVGSASSAWKRRVAAWPNRIMLALAASMSLCGCFASPLPRVAPEQIGPDGLSLLGPRPVRVVGVTTSSGSVVMFDSAPAARMTGNVLVAHADSATHVIRRDDIAAIWVAGPAEPGTKVETRDVRKALAFGLAHPYLFEGQYVRVWAPSARLSGEIATLAAMSPESLGVTFTNGNGSRSVKVVADSVRRLEVSRGTKRNAGLGFAAGALIGFIAGISSDPGKPGSMFYMGRGGQAVALGLVIGLPGALIGALTPTDRWETVSHEQLLRFLRSLPRAPAAR